MGLPLLLHVDELAVVVASDFVQKQSLLHNQVKHHQILQHEGHILAKFILLQVREQAVHRSFVIGQWLLPMHDGHNRLIY